MRPCGHHFRLQQVLSFNASLREKPTGCDLSVFRLGSDRPFDTKTVGLHQAPTLCRFLYQTVFVKAFGNITDNLSRSPLNVNCFSLPDSVFLLTNREVCDLMCITFFSKTLTENSTCKNASENRWLVRTGAILQDDLVPESVRSTCNASVIEHGMPRYRQRLCWESCE